MPILAYLSNLGMGGGGVLVPSVSAGPTPAGIVRRRRYIMPDGQVLMATTQEAVSFLQLYARPKYEAVPYGKQAASIRAPQIVLEKRDIRFLPAEDAALGTWKALISERFFYRAPPEAYRQAEILANRMRADDEAIVALLM